MPDDLKIRLLVEEQIGQVPGVGGPAQAVAASSAARSSQTSKLGTSLAFERTSSFWELDMERIQHRLFHSVSKSGIKLAAGMAIGELVGSVGGGSFVGDLGARMATGFAFGGPTGVAIATLHTLVEKGIEQIREVSKRAEEQLKTISELRRSFEEDRKLQGAKERQRERDLQFEIQKIKDDVMGFARDLQYQTFQFIRN